MNRGAFFAVLVLILPLRAEAQSNWNQGLAGSVYASAFAFMAPRTLGIIPMGELTLWGLRGLTALDPSVGPTMDQRSISLVDRERIVLSMPLPRGRRRRRLGCGRRPTLRPRGAAVARHRRGRNDRHRHQLL